jgi:hypothetical protein
VYMPAFDYNNPNLVPMGNGQIRVVTPPSARPLLDPNKRIFEFLIPHPMLIADHADWPNIRIQLGTGYVELAKPILASGVFEAAGRLGNETPEAYCTIMRAVAGKGTASDSTEIIASMIESTLAWIRVRARHYWLLHGSRGFGASYRGSILENGRMSNFVTAGPTVVVRPLTRGMWELIAADISIPATPPISESIFCDGLLSAVAGDELKALLELGVACEVELTQMLTAAAGSAPPSPDKTRFLAPKRDSTTGDYANFQDKLETWPQRLGLDEVSKYPATGILPHWVDLVQELYGLRGGIAHSGKKKPGGTTVQTYIMAANSLFAYSMAQRVKVNLPQYAFDPEESPARQVVLYRDNTFMWSGAQGS